MQCINTCHNRKTHCGKVISPAGSLGNQRGAENVEETEPIRARSSERQGRVQGGRRSGTRQGRQVPFLTSRGRSEHVCSMVCSKVTKKRKLLNTMWWLHEGRNQESLAWQTNTKKIKQTAWADMVQSNPLFNQWLPMNDGTRGAFRRSTLTSACDSGRLGRLYVWLCMGGFVWAAFMTVCATCKIRQTAYAYIFQWV